MLLSKLKRGAPTRTLLALLPVSVKLDTLQRPPCCHCSSSRPVKKQSDFTEVIRRSQETNLYRIFTLSSTLSHLQRENKYQHSKLSGLLLNMLGQWLSTTLAKIFPLNVISYQLKMPKGHRIDCFPFSLFFNIYFSGLHVQIRSPQFHGEGGEVCVFDQFTALTQTSIVSAEYPSSRKLRYVKCNGAVSNTIEVDLRK